MIYDIETTELASDTKSNKLMKNILEALDGYYQEKVMEEMEIMNEYYSIREQNPIELLGYSKNHMIRVKELVENLPTEYIDKLSQAYKWFDDIQEYLYIN